MFILPQGSEIIILLFLLFIIWFIYKKYKKKGIGWLLSIMGGLSTIRGLMMIGQEIGTGSGVFLWGIGFFALGVWMIKTSKPKEKDSQNNRDNK